MPRHLARESVAADTQRDNRKRDQHTKASTKTASGGPTAVLRAASLSSDVRTFPHPAGIQHWRWGVAPGSPRPTGLDFRHAPSRGNRPGATGWPDQEVDVFLDDFGDGRCALRIVEQCVLRDFEGLTVGIQDPFEGFCFEKRRDSKAL
jgi:hypothetical protein